jgi:hypothetical protein
MASIWIALAAVVILAGSVPAYRALRGWRLRRRAAWELERAAWRAWLLRP